MNYIYLLGLDNWCAEFSTVWYVLGIILRVIYVATPLLLIVTGSITFIQAMMKDKSDNLAKASNLLIKKIIVSLVIFMLLPLSKIVLGFVADEGWYDCAKCVFELDCEGGGLTTG